MLTYVNYLGSMVVKVYTSIDFISITKLIFSAKNIRKQLKQKKRSDTFCCKTPFQLLEKSIIKNWLNILKKKLQDEKNEFKLIPFILKMSKN